MDEVPSPLKDDVVVWVVMKNGERLESSLMPGVIADEFRKAIEMRRDKARNAEKVRLPEPKKWLDGIDFSKVADVGVEYRGSSKQ